MRGGGRPGEGKVKILRFTDAHDSGTVINPMAFHAQVEGSIVMGSGEVLTEDVVFDERGRILNPNLHDYRIPTIADAPEVESIAVPSYEPRQAPRTTTLTSHGFLMGGEGRVTWRGL